MNAERDDHAQGESMDTPKPACPSCGKPIETPVSREIRERGTYDRRSRRYTPRVYTLAFCSTTCGGNYQMGCEG